MSDNKELIALLAFASTRAGTVSDVMVRRQLLLDTIAALEADKQGEAVVTPAARLREAGEPDPHGTYYNCERSKLCLGHLTDDELANEVFMKGGIVELTAAKERIRWLSRKLVTQPDRKEIEKRDEVGEVLAAEGEFTKWFIANYPGPDTIIHNPLFHAPKIFSVAWANIRRARKEPIDRKEIEDEPTEEQYQQAYLDQCATTDEWAKKYRDEVDRKADATLLARCDELEKIAEAANKRAIELQASLDLLTPKLEDPSHSTDCPHAAPFRYCPKCVATPCPIGLDKK